MKIGFLGLLTIVFIALKLTGVIAWSWIWVLSPLWIGVALVLAIIAAYLLTVLIFTGWMNFTNNNKG